VLSIFKLSEVITLKGENYVCYDETNA
jgi:hypothetical protein